VTHLLLTYAIFGTGTALVIATVDLLTPKRPPMGMAWTLLQGLLWPLFAGIVVVVLFKLHFKSRIRKS